VRFEAKTVLVTGAASGMGRACAERFAGHGARVVVADLDEQAAEAVAGEIGDRATALAMDVSDSGSVNDGIERILAGHGRLDVVVNNAGGLVRRAVHELDEGDWDKLMSVNLKGVYLVSKAAWPSLVASKGTIVNFASILASQAMQDNAVYCTSKAGVVMLTKCMALDGARAGVRVNCVSPGWIETPMTDRYFEEQDDPVESRRAANAFTPLGRMGRPNDVADAVLYLASDAAEWVTGSELTVDGGINAGSFNG
jgi:meso-butanediol dehydrogenase / (S,S)-butanediol dehydrogenase / diacetyl reductase